MVAFRVKGCIQTLATQEQRNFRIRISLFHIKEE